MSGWMEGYRYRWMGGYVDEWIDKKKTFKKYPLQTSTYISLAKTVTCPPEMQGELGIPNCSSGPLNGASVILNTMRAPLARKKGRVGNGHALAVTGRGGAF